MALPRAGDSRVLSMFQQGNIIVLESKASNKSLRINNGEVEGRGGQGTWAQFYVHVRRPGVVALQNVNNTSQWVAIHNHKLIGTGQGGPYCDFLVCEVGGGEVALESTMYPGQHVGILPDGSSKAPGSTGTGAHGRFMPMVLSQEAVVKGQQPPVQPGYVQPSPGYVQPAGSVFRQGNIIVLESKASNKTLRINNGDVEGRGGRGRLAQFYVHMRRPGVVALQNVNNTNNWLAIHNHQLIGTGQGGPYCEFQICDLGGGEVALESTMYPGQHVGVLPDGNTKAPGSTGTGQHGRFRTIVISEEAVVGVHPPPPVQPVQHQPPVQPQPPTYQPSAPPPLTAYPAPTYPAPATAGTYPPPPATAPGYPPPAGYPPAQPAGYPPAQPTGYPPVQPTAGAYPPTQPTVGAYPPPVQPGYAPAQPPPVQSQGPAIPTGYNIMDSFQSGNSLQLICRGNGYPVDVQQGRIQAKGFFGKPLSIWMVTVPPGSAPGIVMFNNQSCPGMYLSIQKKGAIASGKGGKFCHFKVMPQPDNYCCFMSVEFPGQYLIFTAHGAAGCAVNSGPTDQFCQFFIRMEKQVGHFSQTIMTPFGRPSVANQLRSDCVIQLYHKPTNMYLGINRNGITYTTAKNNDEFTYFVVKDRGMGIIGFETQKFPGYRLRMENSALKGKGIADLNADFRLKEAHDGTACFESVTCPGAYICISAAGGLQTNLGIFLLQIQRFGATQNVTKTPLN